MRCAGPLAGLAAAALTGCGSSIYRWSGYEGSIATFYAHRDDDILVGQVRSLSNQVGTAQRAGRVPPGMLAHLAYFYYLNGDTTTAAKYLRAEKEAFPESAHFVEFILRQIQ